MIAGLCPELLTPGGIQRSSCLAALALISFAEARGESCRFVSLRDPSGAASINTGGREIRFIGCGGSKRRFLSISLALAIRQPTIAVAFHPNLAPIVAMMKMLAPGVCNVVVVHGVEVWTPLSFVRRLALQSADRALAPSEDTLLRAIQEQRLTRTKVRKLAWSLGPDFDPCAGLRAAAPPPAGFPRGRVILTVGRWDATEAYKGVDHLIVALPALLKSFPDVHLVAFGEGTDLPRLQSLAQNSGCMDHIHFLPFIPHDQLPAAYDSCDVFAMPSSGEGFGIVFIEAMARGKPVIGGAHGGTPDVIDDRVNGFLVPHGDVTQLVDRLARLLENESLRREMGAQALAKVRRHFTFARFSSELAVILTELLD